MTGGAGSLRVAIYGTGRTAAELTRQLERTPHELVAVLVHDPAKAGREIASFVEGATTPILTTLDIDRVLGDLRPDVLLYGGLGGDVLVDAMRRCLLAGADFINATFIHPVTALGSDVALDLEEVAKEAGARALGTGVNPGLWLDVLPALIATACEGRPHVSARRVTDISFWGDDVLRAEVGVGRATQEPPARFYGSLTESALVLAEALGVELDEIRRTGNTVLATVATRVGGVEVAPGAIQGFDQAVVGVADGQKVLEVGWIGIPDPPSDGLAPGVNLELVGETGATVRVCLTPPPDPYPGTAARLIKSIRPLRELPPGLHTPASVQRLGAFTA
jgi:hypothetical protein